MFFVFMVYGKLFIVITKETSALPCFAKEISLVRHCEQVARLAWQSISLWIASLLTLARKDEKYVILKDVKYLKGFYPLSS